MMLDISNALNYIHTKVFLLHGDVKSYNVLVNGDFEICKLCDFGVSLPLDKTGNLDKGKTKRDYIGNAISEMKMVKFLIKKNIYFRHWMLGSS